VGRRPRRCWLEHEAARSRRVEDRTVERDVARRHRRYDKSCSGDTPPGAATEVRAVPCDGVDRITDVRVLSSRVLRQRVEQAWRAPILFGHAIACVVGGELVDPPGFVRWAEGT